jgi:hypothetical protein
MKNPLKLSISFFFVGLTKKAAAVKELLSEWSYKSIQTFRQKKKKKYSWSNEVILPAHILFQDDN